MEYQVKLTYRAFRDLQSIYNFIHAESSKHAFAWFNRLSESIYSLEHFPERGATAPEDRQLRQLVFGRKPHTFRIIYAVDKRRGVINVLHIRHGARAPLS